MDVSFDFVNEGVPSKILKIIFKTSNLRKTFMKNSKDAPNHSFFFILGAFGAHTEDPIIYDRQYKPRFVSFLLWQNPLGFEAQLTGFSISLNGLS